MVVHLVISFAWRINNFWADGGGKNNKCLCFLAFFVLCVNSSYSTMIVYANDILKSPMLVVEVLYLFQPVSYGAMIFYANNNLKTAHTSG